jgi:sodium-dependent dicarboxylate transporter 2/3/5
MMIAALRPLLAGAKPDDPFRRALLLGVATGANFGGIATPIGTGPNAIAIAAVTDQGTPVTFLSWMTFALPLAVGLVLAGLLLAALRFRVRGASGLPEVPRAPLTGAGRAVVAVFFAAVAAWLTEPLHGIPAAVVALAVTAVLFGSRLLEREDLGRLDWATLILIAGGLSLGSLLDQSGLVQAAAAAMPFGEASPFLRLFALCLACAMLSALMSNTATATLLIPLAASLGLGPSTTVLIAIAASLGVPFAISTPPNAMVYGEGGIRLADLVIPGLVLMILGCLLISATGPAVLALAGIP